MHAHFGNSHLHTQVYGEIQFDSFEHGKMLHYGPSLLLLFLLSFSFSGAIYNNGKRYLVATVDEPFQAECTASPDESFHPEWYFTRDEDFRDPMGESCEFSLFIFTKLFRLSSF